MLDLGRSAPFFACLVVASAISSEEIDDAEPQQYLALELLDRTIVVQNRVKAVSAAISETDSSEAESPGTCLVESFEFDRNGNLVLHRPPLVGSYYYYSYNENNLLVDFGEIDSDGDTYSLAEYLGPHDGATRLVQAYEAPVVRGKTAYLRTITSVCFNIDAEYKFYHEVGDDGLPSTAYAEKIREMNTGVFAAMSKLRSPEALYVRFKYEVWSDIQ